MDTYTSPRYLMGRERPFVLEIKAIIMSSDTIKVCFIIFFIDIHWLAPGLFRQNSYILIKGTARGESAIINSKNKKQVLRLRIKFLLYAYKLSRFSRILALFAKVNLFKNSWKGNSQKYFRSVIRESLCSRKKVLRPYIFGTISIFLFLENI